MKYHHLSGKQIKDFTEVIKNIKEQPVIRSSLISILMEMAKHHSLPDFVTKEIEKIIYRKKEPVLVKRQAMLAFIEIASNPNLHTDSTVQTLKYIVHDNKNLRHIRESAAQILTNIPSDNYKKQSTLGALWNLLKSRCWTVF